MIDPRTGERVFRVLSVVCPVHGRLSNPCTNTEEPKRVLNVYEAYLRKGPTHDTAHCGERVLVETRPLTQDELDEIVACHPQPSLHEAVL